MKPIRIPLLFTAFVVSCCLSCSSLLYYPDHVMYVEQELMEIKPDDVVLKIASGGEVHGWYISSPDKPKGVVVFFHGNGENRTSHIVDVYWMAKAGYDIFAVEYPGYGETDGSPTPQNTVESGHAALRYVAQKKPGLPIVVYGHSLGGAVALRTVLDLKSEIPVALVVVADTFLSYRKIGQRVLSRAWATWLFQWVPLLVLSDKYAPGDQVSKLAPIPLLVIHYKDDPIVPYISGEEIFRKASEPKEFWTFEGIEHNQLFAGEKGHERRARLVKRLAEILPPPPEE